MTHEGPQVLRGLAWSGNGKVKRVDVSFDGGNNWVQAELQGPVIDKALTRFYVPWTWTGETVLMQSRAIDESGYVQPTYQQLHDLRGVNSVYHNNGIQTWRINPDGTVENVRMG